MFSFVRTAAKSCRAGSHIAMAIAMAGAVVTLGAGLEAPAYAQKEKKEKAPKAEYSKGFVDAYKPLNDAFGSANPDFATIKAGLPSLMAALETDDDRFAAGNLVYNVAVKTKDFTLQREGVDMMLKSGKVSPEQLGLFNFIGGQLAYNMKDFDAARTYLQAALDAGYTEGDPKALIAESYFAQDQAEQGLTFLSQEIARKRQAGEPVDTEWLARGFAVAYTAGLGPQAADYGAMLVDVDPSKANWGNAIGVLRIYGNYDDQGLLDLLRLSKRTDSLQNERDYVDYIEAADARRLPAEVNKVVQEGIAVGVLKSGDVFVAEAKNISSGRLTQDKADLPGLAKDARAAGATAKTAMAAGDAFLSWDDPKTAEEMYTTALGKPGVDTARVQTRLGIAQADQGKWADAEATFAKITGPRAGIARLWTLYVDHKSGGATPAAPAATEPAPAQ
jgi:tetratricopeptide (TPR) repeat protein